MLSEEEIRPRAIFDEYLRLAQIDAVEYFDNVRRIRGSCPACTHDARPAFSKNGFTYEECPECRTLFVNPRPPAEAFERYYTESPSVRYWATTFYRQTADARREKLWKPKVEMVLGILAERGAVDHEVVDIGGGYGIFAEEMRDRTGRAPNVIEPGPLLASACRERLLPVIEKFLEHVTVEDLPAGPKAFVSFELFEHLVDPAGFLEHLGALMSGDDLFLFTTLSGTGVDIRALWANSKSVSPPHHLNFLNPRSVRLLLARVGLELLQVTTPGKLDLDILANNADQIEDRFWSAFIETADVQERNKWQEFVSANGRSSHMMVLCRKLARDAP